MIDKNQNQKEGGEIEARSIFWLYDKSTDTNPRE